MISLPMAADAAPAAVVSPSPALRGGTETVLVVEDNPHVRALVSTILRELGYTVLEAATGADALRVCTASPAPIHLLITDVVMPEVGGQEVAAQLLAVCPNLKVLYMSGYAEAAIAAYGVLQPGAEFLQKPFTPPELARKVRLALAAPGA
jgi:CheY-like chemotaxis protein